MTSALGAHQASVPSPSYHRSGATALGGEELGRLFTLLGAVAAPARCTRAALI
jgi:hypothetical protein